MLAPSPMPTTQQLPSGVSKAFRRARDAFRYEVGAAAAKTAAAVPPPAGRGARAVHKRVLRGTAGRLELLASDLPEAERSHGVAQPKLHAIKRLPSAADVREAAAAAQRKAARIAAAVAPPAVELPRRSDTYVNAVAKLKGGRLSSWAACIGPAGDGRSLAELFLASFPRWVGRRAAAAARAARAEPAPALPPPAVEAGGWLQNCISAADDAPLSNLKLAFLSKDHAVTLKRAQLVASIVKRTDAERESLLQHFTRAAAVRRAVSELQRAPQPDVDALRERCCARMSAREQPQQAFAAFMEAAPLQEHFKTRFPDGLPTRAKRERENLLCVQTMLRGAAAGAVHRAAEREWAERRDAAAAVQRCWRSAQSREAAAALRAERSRARAASVLQEHWRGRRERAARAAPVLSWVDEMRQQAAAASSRAKCAAAAAREAASSARSMAEAACGGAVDGADGAAAAAPRPLLAAPDSSSQCALECALQVLAAHPLGELIGYTLD
eukprot:TRINITY_DN705_c1_g1_i1.p3 TRINITY_DN705_c1_g1~~TRINITY_DN705_c1_g1_i1.p3  ORF type:complete len:498 (+),score=202.44 TRINITY_DN705_c1_g1_i1:87-1580(+)